MRNQWQLLFGVLSTIMFCFKVWNKQYDQAILWYLFAKDQLDVRG